MDFLNNPKNRPLVIAGAVVILVVALFIVWRMTRSQDMAVGPTSPGPGTMQPTGLPGSTPTGTVTPSGGPGPGAPGPGGAGGEGGPGQNPMGGSGSTGPALTGAPTGAPAAPPPGATPTPAIAKLPSRSDPFSRTEGFKAVTRLSLPRVMVRPRAPETATTGGEQEVQVPTTNKRMAGVLWNGGVAAILVDEDKSYVVRPGDVIGNMVVESIKRNSLTLRIGRGAGARQEEVFLRPAVPKAREAGYTRPTGPSGPGGPGGPTRPGGPMMPGGPGGGGAGGGGGVG